MRNVLSLTSALMLGLAGPTFAQTTDQQPGNVIIEDGQGPTSAAQESEMDTQAAPGSTDEILVEQEDTHFRADSLLGIQVVNSRGEELGTVDDIILEDNGRLVGLVLSTGGFLGLGAKRVAISWNEANDLTGATDTEALTVNLTKDQLAAAPPYKTKEQKESEEEAQQAPDQSDMLQQDQTSPAPTQ